MAEILVRELIQSMASVAGITSFGSAIKPWFQCCAVLGVLLLLGFTTCQQRPDGSEVVRIQKDLETEFAKIAVLPGAIVKRHSSMSHAQNAGVTSDYTTSENYRGIRTHYDNELPKHGWKFIKEEDVLSWRRNLGGKEAFYCKGDYTAVLQYAGEEESEVGWTYSFSLNWNVSDECHPLAF